MKTFKILAASALIAGTLAGCGAVTDADLIGTWNVREVADENYPDLDEGVVCDYSETGSLVVNDGLTGDLTLRYTGECGGANAEVTYNWNVRAERLEDDTNDFEIVLDGDNSNEDLLCSLNDGRDTLNCTDEEGNAWRFER